MKSITEKEFDAAIDAELTETFELVVGQTAYLEVLRGETHYVGILRDYKVGEFYNASALFAHDGEYAFVKAEKSGEITTSFFEYESLGDAKRHAMQLLTKALSVDEPEESDKSRTARFETIKDLLEESDMADIKIARELMDEEATAVEDNDPKRTEEIHCAAFTLDCIIEPDIYAI